MELLGEAAMWSGGDGGSDASLGMGRRGAASRFIGIACNPSLNCDKDIVQCS